MLPILTKLLKFFLDTANTTVVVSTSLQKLHFSAAMLSAGLKCGHFVVFDP